MDLLVIYPGSRHDIHNDLDHTQVVLDIIGWIARHEQRLHLLSKVGDSLA